eukprot:m.76554 g.76554  ORF g.76554 m.76554 type:complete len:265 (+) comp11888_c0_seq1:659-1453(+)
MVEFKFKRLFSNLKFKKSKSGSGSGFLKKKKKNKKGGRSDEQLLVRPKINDILLNPQQPFPGQQKSRSQPQLSSTQQMQQTQPMQRDRRRYRAKPDASPHVPVDKKGLRQQPMKRNGEERRRGAATPTTQNRRSGEPAQRKQRSSHTPAPLRQHNPQSSRRPPRPASRDITGLRRKSKLDRQNAVVNLVPLSKEFLDQIAVKPFSLSEKLKRWDNVTDFDNPVPPPEPVSHLSRQRQGSTYSGTSLMDWQTFAIRQARRRKTQV